MTTIAHYYYTKYFEESRHSMYPKLGSFVYEKE